MGWPILNPRRRKASFKQPSTCQWDKTVLFTVVAAFTLLLSRWIQFMSLNSGIRN